METIITTVYRVTYEGLEGYICPSTYSKFVIDGEYGYAEALDHIRELKQLYVGDKMPYADKVMQIKTDTRVVTKIDII